MLAAIANRDARPCFSVVSALLGHPNPGRLQLRHFHFLEAHEAKVVECDVEFSCYECKANGR